MNLELTGNKLIPGPASNEYLGSVHSKKGTGSPGDLLGKYSHQEAVWRSRGRAMKGGETDGK